MSRNWSLDTRSLALSRILIGTIAFVDLVARGRDAEALYTDRGILPLAVHQAIDFVWRFSPLETDGSILMLTIVFALAMASTIAFVLGWRTRWSGLISYFAISAIQLRNPLVVHGGDQVVCFSIFWLSFLPCNEHFSVLPNKNSGLSSNGWPAAGLIAQISIIYLTAGILKFTPTWIQQGDALAHCLSLTFFSAPTSAWALGFPSLLTLASRITPVFEVIAGLAILFNRGRVLAVMSLVIFHISLIIFMSLGSFPMSCIAMLCSLLPASFWGREEYDRRQVPSIAVSVITAIALFIALGSVAASLEKITRGTSRLGILKNLAQQFAFNQSWTLFAPEPLSRNGWVEVEGLTSTGIKFQLGEWLWNRRNIETSAQFVRPPASAFGEFNSIQWRKYIAHFAGFSFDRRKALADYACRKWNPLALDEQGPLIAVQISFMRTFNGRPPERASMSPVYCQRE